VEINFEPWSKPIMRYPSYVWEEKLRETKVALKEWVKDPTIVQLKRSHIYNPNLIICNIKWKKGR
jgi:hypothetical protein